MSGCIQVFKPYERPLKPSQVPIKNYTLKPPGHDTEYHIDAFTGSLLQYWFTGMIFDLSWTTPGTTAYYGTQDMAQFFYQAQNNSESTSEPGSGIKHVIDRISNVLTTHIRSSDPQRLMVAGSALGTQTFVHARWYWSVLPGALVALTLLFMAWTILLSVRGGIPTWKSSCLAVMVHGLSDSVSSQITATKLSAMENNARDFAMILAVEESNFYTKGMP